jgi:hypothetical protein
MEAETRSVAVTEPDAGEHWVRRWVLHPLAIVLALGIVLRVLAMIGYGPAYALFTDSQRYIYEASGNFFLADSVHPMGYPAFLRILHEIWASMTAVTIVQHLLGLATAVLLYLIVRRLGGSRVLSAIAAGSVALVPDFVFFERAIMTESLFLFLFVLALYMAVRGYEAVTDNQPPLSWARWLAIAGLALGCATVVRVIGEVTIPVFAVVLAVAVSGTLLKRVSVAGAVLVPALLVIGAYSAFAALEDGRSGLTGGSGWALYARTAPFADCSKFTPPEGTESLCETSDPDTRQGPDFYAWADGSPGRALAIGPPHNDDVVGSFAREVVINQPLDYVETVATDLWRYVDPDSGPHGLWNGHPPAFFRFEDPHLPPFTDDAAAQYYGTYSYDVNGLGTWLGDLQQVIRIHGVLLVAVVLLSICGAVLGNSRVRFGIALLGLSALALMAVPVAFGTYESRYGLVAYPALVVAGLLGARELVDRFREARVRNRTSARDPHQEFAGQPAP